MDSDRALECRAKHHERLPRALPPLKSQAKEPIHDVQRRAPAVFSPRQCKAVSVQSRPRLLGRVAWLRAVWLVLKRWGVCKDIRMLILWSYLGRFAFHDETKTLKSERIWARKQFLMTVKANDLFRCLKFETRLLRMETGDLLISHLQNVTRGHRLSHRLTPCFHQGVWARAKNPRTLLPEELGSPGGMREPSEE